METTSTRNWIARDITNDGNRTWNKLKMINNYEDDNHDDRNLTLEQTQKIMEIQSAEQTLDCILYDFSSQLYMDKKTGDCFILAEVNSLNMNKMVVIPLFHNHNRLFPLGLFTKIPFPVSSAAISQVVIVSSQIHLFLDHQQGKSYVRWLTFDDHLELVELTCRECIYKIIHSSPEDQGQGQDPLELGFLHAISLTGVFYRWNFSFHSLCWEEIGTCLINPPENEDTRCIPIFKEYDLNVNQDQDQDQQYIPFKITPDRYHSSSFLGIWFAMDSVLPSRIIFGSPFFDVYYPLEDDQDQIFQAGKCQWIDPSSIYKTSTTIRFYTQEFKHDIQRIYYHQEGTRTGSSPQIFSPVECVRVLIELSTGNRLWMNCSVVVTDASTFIKKFCVWFEDAEYDDPPKLKPNTEPSPPKKKQRR
jgi:hypothetical protein